MSAAAQSVCSDDDFDTVYGYDEKTLANIRQASMFTTTRSICSEDSQNDSEGDEDHAHDIDENVVVASSEISKRLTDDASSSSLLENLPSELRSRILSNMPDLPSLRALVRASPTMHAQYRENRDNILHACLDRELDGFYVDAQATLMSRAGVLGSPRVDEMITAFAESYGQCLAGSVPRSRVGSTEPGAIRWLAAYHLSVARPMLRMYSEWALGNLAQLSRSVSVAGSGSTTGETETNEHGLVLSRSEEIRILRAIYRYDTYHHLFGVNKGYRQISTPLDDDQVIEMFFCLFDPWEVEAIVCLDVFIRKRYDEIFDEVQLDLDDDNPKYWTEDGFWCPTVETYDLSDRMRGFFMEGTIFRGLKVAVRLFAVDDHDTLVVKVSRSIEPNPVEDPPAQYCFSSYAQKRKRDNPKRSPDARDEAERRRDLMEFGGDAVPPDTPPIAWVILWDGKYVNFFGECVPGGLSEWGYVIWCERRLAQAGVKETIFKQWRWAPKHMYVKGMSEHVLKEY